MYRNNYYRYPRRGGITASGILTITGLALLVVVGIYIYIRRKANADSKNELPSSYADETFTATEGKIIRSFAVQLMEDIKGVNIYHNKDLYEAVLKQSDRIFAGIAVDYKRLAGESFRQAINDETSFNFTAPQKKIKERLLSRLSILELF